MNSNTPSPGGISNAPSLGTHYLFELVCTAGEQCVLYDADVKSAWWNHCDGRTFDEVGPAIVVDVLAHRTICEGLLTINPLEEPDPRKSS